MEEAFGSYIIFGIIVLIIYLSSTLKQVPPNTTIIIDRDTHFYKKKKHGYYILNSKRDMVTTVISNNPVEQTYTNIFKTHDDVYYSLTFSVVYHATDLDMVLTSLQDSHRSIYDVVNCSVETVVASFTSNDMARGNSNNDIFFKQLESMLEPFYIDATKFSLISFRYVAPNYGMMYKFNRHISSGNNPLGNSPFSLDESFDSYGDDPFKPL